MQWTDEAIVLGNRRYGESASLLEVMTPAHGRHMGLVRGGRGKRLSAVLQPGNSLQVTWQARLDEQLGTFTVEGGTLRAGALMGSACALHALGWVAALLRLLPERDPHEGLYAALAVVLDHADQPAVLGAVMARFELALLGELGFGLDLAHCAATGATQDLVYVSPKSGRAVSREAGAPWQDRLLPLPAFLGEARLAGATPAPQDIRAALALTGFFLDRDVFGPRGIAMPEGRAGYLRLAPASPA